MIPWPDEGALTTSTDAPGAVAIRRDTWDLPVVVFSALFAALLIAAVAALLGDWFFFGAPLAGLVLAPCAAILIGLAAHRAGRPGARPILFAASIVALAVTVADIISSADSRQPHLGGAITPAVAAVLAGLAVVASLGTHARAAPGTWVVARVNRHRLAAAILVGLSVVMIAVQVIADLGEAGMADSVRLGQYLLAVAQGWGSTLAITVVLWWWGSGWLLAVIGLGTLVGVVAYAIPSGPTASTGATVLFGIASVAIGLLPPKVYPARRPQGGYERASRRPTVAAVWALFGAFLLLPTMAMGRLVMSMGDCFSQCPVASPLAGLAASLDLPLLLVILLLALRLAFAPRGGRTVPLLGLATAAFLLVQIVLGQLDVFPFQLMGFAAPATLLIGVGFGAALLPTRFSGAGRLAAVAIGCLVTVWVWASFVFVFGITWPTHLSTLIEAGVAALALAAAFDSPQRAAGMGGVEDEGAPLSGHEIGVGPGS